MQVFTAIVVVLFAVLIFARTGSVDKASADPVPATVLGFSVKDIDGNDIALSKYAGKVLLIVNVASHCGNTKQYKPLEALYEKYREQGFEVLAFPANDFAFQEPGSNTDIKQFCTSTFSVTFPLFSKISVKGDDIDPLYRYLTDKKTDLLYGGSIEWNFAKFLVDRNGRIVGRFKAGHSPDSPDVVSAIENQLKQSGPS
jgi:glutathione peroxidase